jgi:hypothetical protein
MENLSDKMKAYLYKLDMSVKKRGLLFSVWRYSIGSRLSPKSAWGSGVLMFLQISD